MQHHHHAVTNEDELNAVISRVSKAQEAFALYSQEQVDQIFLAAAAAANRQRLPLANMAAEETGMGIMEDKVMKNHFAAEYICNAYRNIKTCGVIEEDHAGGITKIAEPVGIIAALIPVTNPTSTTIFKILLSLKTRNGIVICPHPRSTKSTIAAAKILLDAAVAAGAPENIIAWIDKPTPALSEYAMGKSDLILATGGPGMVKAAYSSGKPAIGVGAGNTPAVIDESADIILAISSILHSKTFDNGLICASEQAVIVPDAIYDAVKGEFLRRGSYVLKEQEREKVRNTIAKDGVLNPNIVGQSTVRIASLAGIDIPDDIKLLIGEVDLADSSEPFAMEKLSPVLAMYRAKDFGHSINIAKQLLSVGGLGHTASIFLDTEKEQGKLSEFTKEMKTCRILVNTPASQGAIGDLYNFHLPPSLTLGCGSWGGNSVSGNIGIHHLLNIKTVAHRRNNMLWFRTPEKVYIKTGCLPHALEELKTVLHKHKAFIVTDSFLYQSGTIKPLEDKLQELGIRYSCYFDVMPDPTLVCAKKGAKQMASFQPDVILAVGGGSAMDAAKIMWLLYEHPDVDFADLSMLFADIRKRIYQFPKMGEKAYFVAVPTTAGTGSEVTPFAVITDETTGIKHPIADYALMPNMAIVDANLMCHAPKSLIASSGIDAVTHALEAYASMMATDYTDSLALQALENLFTYLPRVYQNGYGDTFAWEKVANAATLAGMAFANAFLGVCHSMAHKLGAIHHIPHGIANGLMIEQVIRFNSEERPRKMGTFPQYDHPYTLSRYAKIAKHLGIQGAKDEDKLDGLILALRKIKNTLAIPESIRDYGIQESDFIASLDAMSEQAFDDQCTASNPRYPLIHEIKEMYRNAYYGDQA